MPKVHQSESNMDAPALLLGIVGQPLGHSLSPKLHNWALSELGLSGVYCRWELPPESLADMLVAVRTLPIHGLSVTIPHKEAIIELLDEVTPFARQVGAVNTLYWKDGALCGDNTDVEGFLTPLRPHEAFDSALVLGAGGAARAALAGLQSLGVPRIGICNRTASRARELAEVFHVQHLDWDERVAFSPGLVVNTTPLGMSGKLEEASPWPADAWGDIRAAYDLVYNPLRTCFLLDATAAGVLAMEGLGMFIGQAQCQFKRWTGQIFPVEAATLLLREALEAKGRA